MAWQEAGVEEGEVYMRIQWVMDRRQGVALVMAWQLVAHPLHLREGEVYMRIQWVMHRRQGVALVMAWQLHLCSSNHCSGTQWNTVEHSGTQTVKEGCECTVCGEYQPYCGVQ